MKYQEPLFRPPAEADSLIFQVAYGCPHNTCRFCGMYKTVKYAERELQEVLDEIEETARQYPAEKRIFLADGDVMYLEYDRLHAIMEQLNRCFAKLARINIYANGSAVMAKTREQLGELRKLKLNTIYLGLETGDQNLLESVNKQDNVEEMIEAVKIAQDCEIRSSVMVLLGLAGKNGSGTHALKTAEALNRMQPRLLSALRFIEVPGSKMFDGYEPVTEYEAVHELKMIIEHLELDRTVFRANHASNPVPIGGRLPQDKTKLIAEITEMLNSNYLDRNGPGRMPFWL